MIKTNHLEYQFSEDGKFISIILEEFVIEIKVKYEDFAINFMKLVKNNTIKDIILKIGSLVDKKSMESKFYISVVLTNNEEIKILNSNFRNKAYATNVLSFPFYRNNNLKDEQRSRPFCYRHFGDIIISMEKIFAEAFEQGKSINNHFLHIFIHGLLHLSGFNHEDDDKAKKMETKEKEILDFIGIKSPY